MSLNGRKAAFARGLFVGLLISQAAAMTVTVLVPVNLAMTGLPAEARIGVFALSVLLTWSSFAAFALYYSQKMAKAACRAPETDHQIALPMEPPPAAILADVVERPVNYLEGYLTACRQLYKLERDNVWNAETYAAYDELTSMRDHFYSQLDANQRYQADLMGGDVWK
jgi:hypothetical protein